MKEIDIAATLEHVRDQRPGLVRSKVTVSLYTHPSHDLSPGKVAGACLSCLPASKSPPEGLPPPPSDHPKAPPTHPRAGAEARPPHDLSPSTLPQDQFEFALTAVAEEVNAILKALPQ